MALFSSHHVTFPLPFKVQVMEGVTKYILNPGMRETGQRILCKTIIQFINKKMMKSVQTPTKKGLSNIKCEVIIQLNK